MDARMLAGLLVVSCGFDASGVDSSDGDTRPGSATVTDGSDDGSDTGSGPGPSTVTATTDGPNPSTTAAPTTTDASTSTDDTSAAESGGDDSSGTPVAESSSGEPARDDTCGGVPMPEIPDALGPVEEISLHGVAFAESGTNLIRVAPGATVSIAFEYDVASCACPGCYTQGMLGIPDDEWRACFYDHLPGCNVVSGTADMQVTAPLAPGFYPLSFWRTWEYGCEPDAGDPPDDTVVAGICVEGT